MEAVGVGFGLFFTLFWLACIAFGIAGFVFWIWALIDCATKEPADGNDKIIWILVIIFTGWIGALIYVLIRRPDRIRMYGE